MKQWIKNIKLLIISNSRSGSTNKLCAEALVDIKIQTISIL